MRRHESGCTSNPARVCRMCKMVAEEGGPEPAPNRDQLLRILDTQGFKAMCVAANECPACILSAVRTQNIFDPDCGLRMSGPEDGREQWSYTEAKRRFWDDWNSAQMQREHPY
jgi:hypothetical protein